MNKVALGLFFAFILFGMLLSPVVLAQDDSDNSGSSDTSVEAELEVRTDNSGSGNADDDKDANDTDEDENDKDGDTRVRERTETRTREILTRGDCTIKIEIRTKIEEGRRVEVVERKMECADGTREEVKIRIENKTVNGEIRERIKYEFRGEEFDVEVEDEIELEEEQNRTHYKLKARLRNGNITDIKIMPDVASEIALERLRALNFTVELREVRHQNVPRVVYNIEANKHGRFLGVFKLAMKVEGQVDPETGEFLGISKPWWAFLVSGEDDDQTDEETDELTINLLEQNDSGESGTAMLTEENGQVTVVLSMTGFVEGVSQPAHIHVGECPDVGSISYPLTNVLNGESETTLNVTLDQLESELPLGINVHKSTDEASVWVSCGDIEF